MSIDRVGGPASSPVQPAQRPNGPASARSTPVAGNGPVAADSPRNSTPATKAPSGPEELKRLSADMQRMTESVAPKLEFAMDESTGKPLIKVVDKATNELILQIPSEEALQIVEQLGKFQQQLLRTQKA
ncbi:MAG: flagellar protein FlaG [Gammaproteobacteria bacterium]|nr:flagellar protein FlaG [Gammaproteobacteria bacterium]MBU1416781.1 flagellar protein FlaG [Gammaproteobacteria bacterium]